MSKCGRHGGNLGVVDRWRSGRRPCVFFGGISEFVFGPEIWFTFFGLKQSDVDPLILKFLIGTTDSWMLQHTAISGGILDPCNTLVSPRQITLVLDFAFR